MNGSPAPAPPAPYQILLEVAEAIASYRDLRELFHVLAERLHLVVEFDYLNLILHDAKRNVMRLHILETSRPTHVEPGLEIPIEWSAAGMVLETQEPLVIADIEKEDRFPLMKEVMQREGIVSLCVLPLTFAQRKLGCLGFGRDNPTPYAAGEVEFMQQAARLVAVAVDNALNYDRVQKYQTQLAEERDRLRLLLEVNNAVISNLDSKKLFTAIAASLRRVLHHDFTSLALYDAKRNVMRLQALDFPQSRGFFREEMEAPLENNTPAGTCFSQRKPVLLRAPDFANCAGRVAELLQAEGVRTIICVPLFSPNRILGTLNVGSLADGAFTQSDVDLLSQVAAQVAIAVENALAYEEIAALKNKLAEEKLYLEDEIRSERNFEEIIGESRSLKKILKQVETVAPTESTVLLQGETGTGKELFARAIHNISERRARTLVKINCAAIPTGLLESELFGHERGAFTGAIAQKIGRFELADGGTLFLDEVGDIPPELQPKLLRVLQEQEFERLGGTRTIRVNIRLVAATNRDLVQMVAERQFRSDLFYRLNVFPIQIPPLRQRREDIPVLVRYFAQKYARQMNRPIDSISADTMTVLTDYHWPGNIRELENLIERAVILSRGSALEVPLAELRESADPETGASETLEAAERDHILRVLRDTGWILAGPKGAAARLGIKRTTLQARITKLGIKRPA
jgi:formate hydrogenlyase transcriptional activator